MKHTTFVFFILAFAMAGCEETPYVPDSLSRISPGEIHNEVLARIDARLGGASMTKAEELVVISAAVNSVAEKYQVDPLTPSEVELHLQQGVDLARSGQSPDQIMASVLSDDEMVWWRHFTNNATPATFHSAYQKTCDRYGAPVQNSTLDIATDIAVSSAEYWYARRLVGKPTEEMGKQTDMLKFLVVVAVDALSGSAAAAGGGGPVGGAIVGGLASKGADTLWDEV